MSSQLRELKEEGMSRDECRGDVPFDELVDFLGLAKYRTLEEEVLKG